MTDIMKIHAPIDTDGLVMDIGIHTITIQDIIIMTDTGNGEETIMANGILKREFPE